MRITNTETKAKIYLVTRYALTLFLLLASGFVTAGQTLHVVKEKPLAANFSLKDVDGVVHRLSDYRGKVVVLNFWATWCPPCREELPSMERAHKLLAADAIKIVAINVGEDADTIFTFTADYEMSYDVLMDTDSKVIKQYPVIGLPTTFVIDPQGRIVYRAVGSRDWADERLLKKLRALLK